MVKEKETLANIATNGGIKYTVQTKKKAWRDSKVSGKDKSMREIKKKYNLQKHRLKALIKVNLEKSKKERDESVTNNFRENAKLFG